jgi:hypothetical protein
MSAEMEVKPASDNANADASDSQFHMIYFGDALVRHL